MMAMLAQLISLSAVMRAGINQALAARQRITVETMIQMMLNCSLQSPHPAISAAQSAASVGAINVQGGQIKLTINHVYKH